MKRGKKTVSVEESILLLVDNIQKMIDGLEKEIKAIRIEVVKQKKIKKVKK